MEYTFLLYRARLLHEIKLLAVISLMTDLDSTDLDVCSYFEINRQGSKSSETERNGSKVVDKVCV